MSDVEVKKWIVEYVCDQLWRGFKIHKTVTDQDRDVIQGLIELGKPIIHLDEYNDRLKLLMLQCFLVDGTNYSCQYANSEEEITVLERFLNNFLDVIDSLGFSKTAFEKTITAIKKQAVIVCCTEDDFECGTDVFNRLWAGDNCNDASDLKAALLSKTKDNNYFTMDRHQYSYFTDSVINDLDKFHQTFAMPFLEKVSQELVKQNKLETTEVLGMALHVPTSSTSEKTKNLSFPSDYLHKLATSVGLKEWKPNEQRDLQKKLRGVRNKTKSRKEDVVLKKSVMNTSRTAEEAMDTEEGHSSRNRSPGKSKDKGDQLILKSREIRQKLQMHQQRMNTKAPQPRSERHYRGSKVNGTSSNNETMSEDSFERSGKLSNNQIVKMRRDKPGRVMWTEEEEDRLIEGVKLFGKGHWVKIRDKFSFPGRTSVNLKDKWRNLVVQGRVEDF